MPGERITSCIYKFAAQQACAFGDSLLPALQIVRDGALRK